MHRRRSSAQIEAIGILALVFANPMLFAIQVVQNMVHDSLTDLTTRLDRSALRIYGSNKRFAGEPTLTWPRPHWPTGHTRPGREDMIARARLENIVPRTG